VEVNVGFGITANSFKIVLAESKIGKTEKNSLKQLKSNYKHFRKLAKNIFEYT
jgi:hypothetical protein